MPRPDLARIIYSPGHVDIEYDELETGAVRMAISDHSAVINSFSQAVYRYKGDIEIGQLITHQYQAASKLVEQAIAEITAGSISITQVTRARIGS